MRAVEISLLARTANTNRGYIDPNTYSIGDVNYNPNDAYRRKLLCSIVKTRNIGL
ncbi:MAG: PilW family protein [Deltaproteobacteria bacterium]|nr:PilW family protein [Deltaproteobacteria bacterium]